MLQYYNLPINIQRGLRFNATVAGNPIIIEPTKYSLHLKNSLNTLKQMKANNTKETRNSRLGSEHVS